MVNRGIIYQSHGSYGMKVLRVFVGEFFALFFVFKHRLNQLGGDASKYGTVSEVGNRIQYFDVVQ